ncbi:MAG TPA: GTPase ObgE [Candidatus Nanoarchaeia archaeon]
MVDFVRIRVKAGDGGDGHISFRTQKGKPYGVADGGDGGDGGDVYIVASKDLNTLAPYRYKKDFEASYGGNGGRNNRTGARAEDLFLEVPLGTLIKDPQGQVIFDVVRLKDRVLIAKGGRGGRGNAHLKHVVKERKEKGEKGLIKVFEKGAPAEASDLILELKILADVGLIGLPNAGKSTLLSKLTAAHPKIADYPFTTLEPNLGVMSFKGKEIVLADIPGLIEGASHGKGLGGEFLRHVERTRLLVHLVSLESQTPLEDCQIVNKELTDYNEKLGDLKQVVCLTKTDLVGESRVKEVEAVFKKNKIKVLTISSYTGAGLEAIKKAIIKEF